MPQPKTPPISIRPSAELLAEVDEWAKARGLTRHAAILALIDFGLGVQAPKAVKSPAPAPPVPASKPAVKRAPAVKAVPSVAGLQVGPPPVAPGSRLKKR